MRVVVAVLLVIGFGALWVSSKTASLAWDWAAAGLSLAACAVLIVDWRRKRNSPQVGDYSTATVLDPATEAQSSQAGSTWADHGASDSCEDSSPRSVDRSGVDEVSEVAKGRVPEVHGPGEDGGSECADRSDGPLDHTLENHTDTNDSPATDAGSRPTAASWFIPNRDGVQANSEPGSGHSDTPAAREQASVAASDATVMFSRVRSNGGESTDLSFRAPIAASRGAGEDAGGNPTSSDAAAGGDEVVVVDELPSYHLAGCNSVDGYPVIALPLWDAEELGFAPCGICYAGAGASW